MTLLHRANKLAEELEKLETLKELAQDVTLFSSRATELEQGVQAFHNMAQLVKIFRNRNILFLYPVNIDLASLCQALETIVANYQSDPKTIKPNADSSRKFWRPLKDYPEQIWQGLEVAWQNYTRNILPTLDKELLEIFEKLPSTKTQVNTIRLLQQQAYKLSLLLPTSEHDIDELKRLVTNIQTAWQRLQTNEIPASVLDFLKAACSGGAALHLLTNEVRQWLADHQLNHAFSISLASSSLHQ